MKAINIWRAVYMATSIVRETKTLAQNFGLFVNIFYIVVASGSRRAPIMG